MRVISLWQPWATLVVLGVKHFETRHWDTAYRGPLLIHAAKKKSRLIQQACLQTPAIVRELKRAGFHYYIENDILFDDLPRGGIIGQVTLRSTFATVDAEVQNPLRVNPDERAFGNFGVGRYAWFLSDPQIFRHMIPLQGRQGFFNYDERKLW